MNAFKTTFIKALNDGKGRLVSFAQGAVVGGVAKFALDRNWSFDPFVENIVSAGVAFAVMWIVDSVLIILQTNGVKKIQDALPSNVISDGVPGDVTVAAVKRAVSDQQS